LAQKLNLNITGTLGLKLTAKKEGILPKIKLLFERIQATNFRIAPAFLESILEQAGE
jgi:predicted nucleic acid-binding protein